MGQCPALPQYRNSPDHIHKNEEVFPSHQTTAKDILAYIESQIINSSNSDIS